jgi:hypothetical protein
MHGESGGADLEGAQKALETIPKIISEGGFSAHDVYNLDETGLLFKAQPNRTLAKGKVKGKKMRQGTHDPRLRLQCQWQ